MFNVVIIWLTRLSSEVVVYIISPVIINILIVVAIYFFCKRLKFTSTQSFFFLVFSCFLNDHMLFTISTAKGGGLALALSLIGLSYYFNKDYIYSTLFLAVSCIMYTAYFGCVIILIGYVIMSVCYKFIKGKLPTSVIRSYREYAKQTLSIVVVSILFGVYLYPLSQPLTVRWEETVTDTSVTDGATPTNTTIPSNITIKKSQVIASKIEQVTIASSWHSFTRFFRPNTIKELALTSLYPFTYFYWSTTSRSAINCTAQVFGYEMTQEDVQNMRNLSLDTPLVLMIIPLLYSFGFPLMFVAVIWEGITTKNVKEIMLGLSSYLLMIGFVLFYFIFGWTIFPHKFIECVGLLWALILARSNIATPNSTTKKIGLSLLTLVVIVRSALFVVATSGIMGGVK